VIGRCVHLLVPAPRLRFPPLEVFAQGQLEPVVPGISCRIPAPPFGLALVILHREPGLLARPSRNQDCGRFGPLAGCPSLARAGSLWQGSARLVGAVSAESVSRARCRSSVVEHSIGNGEVDSSILSGSTSLSRDNNVRLIGVVNVNWLNRFPVNGTKHENSCK
jgi:hypothetical protein